MLIKKLILKRKELFLVWNMVWLKACFLLELEPELEPEPVKKIPGAGQKRTGSTTLLVCVLLVMGHSQNMV